MAGLASARAGPGAAPEAYGAPAGAGAEDARRRQTITAIADVLGVDRSTVYRALDRTAAVEKAR